MFSPNSSLYKAVIFVRRVVVFFYSFFNLFLDNWDFILSHRMSWTNTKQSSRNVFFLPYLKIVCIVPFSDCVLHLLHEDHSHSAEDHDAFSVAVVLWGEAAMVYGNSVTLLQSCCLGEGQTHPGAHCESAVTRHYVLMCGQWDATYLKPPIALSQMV